MIDLLGQREQQAVINLAYSVRHGFDFALENSHRYVESGGKVHLRLEQRDGVSLFLEDSGPGVSDQQLEHLFDRFYRAEGSRSRSTGGSGLGLSICKNIVEAHGGHISASHSELGGLALRVELPA